MSPDDHLPRCFGRDRGREARRYFEYPPGGCNKIGKPGQNFCNYTDGILLQLEEFPKILLQPDDNSHDIIRFVEERLKSIIEEDQLLLGSVPEELKTEIRDTLCTRSKGM